MSAKGPAAAAPQPPRLQLTLKSRAGVQAFWGPHDVAKVDRIVSENARTFEYSRDGSLLAMVNPENVIVYITETGVVRRTIPRPQVQAISFSPLGNYLVTFERLDQNLNEYKNNLIVWKLEDVTPLVEFSQKNFISENWPTIKWSDDEAYCGRTVTNEVHLFAPKGFTPAEVKRRIQLNDVSNMAFAPGSHPYKLAVYVPEKKGSPASVRIYNVPLPAAPVEIRQITNKSFYKSSSAEFLWNKTGTSLLISTSTDVDKTGKSYYGETGLYCLAADGSFNCNVVLQKEGPIHGVAWSPLGKEFIVTYGFMPAQSTLFDSKCVPILDFGEAPRNTIRWSPNGKTVCLGGFGNLQGQMDFWDVKSVTKVGTAQAHCAAVCEWAPDSRHFVAAIVSPRIRVDNGYKIFRHDGALVYETAVNELYQVVWRPALSGVYPDRPLSPLRVGGIAGSSSSTSTPAVAAAPAKYQHPNATKYQHPNATGMSSPLRSEDTGVRKYSAPLPARIPKPEDHLPPGWVVDDPVPEKKKKPKKNKKKAVQGDDADKGKQEEGVPEQDVQEVTEEVKSVNLKGKNKNKKNTSDNTNSPSTNSPSTNSPNTNNNNNKNKNKNSNNNNNNNSNNNSDNTNNNNNTNHNNNNSSSSKPRASPVVLSSPQPSPSSPGPNDAQKKAKALSKKLVQIERLKKKQTEGAVLSPAEVEKVNTEAALLKEINAYANL